MHRPPYPGPMGIPTRNPGVGYNPVGKMTNNQDPKSKSSRVFVGNLNTGAVSEQQLFDIFAPYGNVTGVSTINGYGFVQFMSRAEAQAAVHGEQGHVLVDQPMDLRIASEPNPARPKGYKRVNQGGYAPYVDPKLLPVIPAASSSQNKKMRFQANSQVGKEQLSGDEPSSWVCAFCQNKSTSAWELMKHASMSHQTQIYIANPDLDGKTE